MKKENSHETEIDEIEEFNNTIQDLQNEDYETEELDNEEIEESGGGKTDAAAWLKQDSAKNGYKKHCGGISVIVKNPQMTAPRVKARIGTIDKLRLWGPSQAITTLKSGPYNGPEILTVQRKPGKLGLVTIEIWGHQKGEAKNYRYMVLRVNFV